MDNKLNKEQIKEALQFRDKLTEQIHQVKESIRDNQSNLEMLDLLHGLIGEENDLLQSVRKKVVEFQKKISEEVVAFNESLIAEIDSALIGHEEEIDEIDSKQVA